MDLRNRPYLRRATEHEWTKDPASRAWDEPTKEAAQGTSTPYSVQSTSFPSVGWGTKWAARSRSRKSPRCSPDWPLEKIPTLWLGRAANLVASSLGLCRRYDGTLILRSQFRATAKSTPFQVSSRVFGRVDYRDLKSKTPRSKSGLPVSQPCWRRIRTRHRLVLGGRKLSAHGTQRGALGVPAITERRSSSRRW
ncbi:conserved hypothetical protein [Coccidioides posadasii str. Silveira]|uniref:Uncharacterized protein n=1 Tax=Coccidioides posadasii (strain RMSCC 757 / Silveira) TaxID=443226 RepID=E9D8V3_COCPS|nr:conserved hypothetical protein [Coccidioides posadasii str. Silveira]